MTHFITHGSVFSIPYNTGSTWLSVQEIKLLTLQQLKQPTHQLFSLVSGHQSPLLPWVFLLEMLRKARRYVIMNNPSIKLFILNGLFSLAVCPALFAVPHSWSRWQAQDWSQPERSLWPQDWPGSRILLHWCQHFQGYHLEWGHTFHLPGKPKEVHPWHKDGICWLEEAARASRPHRLPRRLD